MSVENRTNSTNDWLECVKWLNNLDCLPFVLKHKYMTNQLQLNEFASFLRDGEILCNLLNRIIPGCIDSSQINKKSQMSQLLCLNNIRLFLNVAKSDKYFNMADSDLFDENMLYDLSDLACVIRTLSAISKHELTIKTTSLNGFKLSVCDLPNSSANTSLKSDSSTRRLSSSGSFESPPQTTHDDIYYNIVPTEVEPPESYYTDESFLLQGLVDQQEKSENSVYQIIVSSPAPAHHQHQPLKRDFVMKEIINTENNFLDGLNILMNDFLIPLGNVLNDQDKEIVFTNMQGLIDLHSNLYNDLYNACKGGQGRTIRICNVFESYKVKLMKEYAKYFSSIDRSRAKCESLMQVSLSSINDHSKHLYITQFRMRLEECSTKSKFGKYKLTDLLNLPYQRVLKYHLLFNELLKQTDVEHSAKETIRRTKECMCELGTYLNECQRDKENLTKIEQLLKYLVINSHDTTRSSVYSSSFNLNLLKDYGHYIKDDKFRIKDQNERSARTRTFFLFEKALLICKAKGNFYNYKETLLINEFSIEDHSSVLSQSSSNLTHGIISNIFGNATLTSNSLNNNLSTSSLNLSSNAHSLHLITHDHQKSYLLIFKNKEHKKEWKDSLLKAKEKMRPEGQRSLKHFFELTNFDVELVTCFVCNKYLVGLFYQGYKCSLCSSIAHKECLTKMTSTCSSLNALPVQAPLLPLLRQRSQHDVKRSPSLKSNHNLQAEAIYKYDGRPVPPELPALVFNQGDLIQVTDDDDDDWWRGYVISKNKEGFFPRRHVKVIQEQKVIRRISETPSLKLEEYQWYSPVDRYLADAILSRIPNDLTETIFMVRCRNEGGYAISIKHKGLIDHIKINIHDVKNFPLTSPIIVSDSDEADFTHVFCIDQQHNFNSLVALVNYFSVHSLKDNFPQLETSLGTPFRKVLPPYLSTGIARHDYNPSMNPNNGGEQIELKVGRKYFVLNKEANGWWRVYNSEGLIGYVPGSYLNEERTSIES